jgi:prevent-host-death family protein
MPISETEIPATEMRNRFSQVLSRAAYGKERFLIARNGRPAAALLPIEDYELFVRLTDENRQE